MSIGDTTLRNNIQKNIEMLEDDDIDLDIFDKPIKQHTPTTHGRGRKRGRGRGRGKNIAVAEPKIGNDNEDNEEVVRFTNGSFHNTELPIKKHEYDEDIFTADSSSLLEVVAEVHSEETQPIKVNQLRSSPTDTETAPANELNPVTNDDSLIVHYQDKFYLVDPGTEA